MSWRERFLIQCGPGVLAGITLGDWITLLCENRFSIDPAYFPRAASISFAAVINSVFRWYEERRYGEKWKDVPVPPPLFVLGHGRSGTTHLHYLLGLDDRFACPQLYQVHYPHTFLSTERSFSALPGFLLPRHRPYDNVRLALNVPDEDEFAMCVLGFMTPYLAGVFPRRAEHYDQFLTFRNAPSSAVEQWKSSLRMFLQKLTLKYGKRFDRCTTVQSPNPARKSSIAVLSPRLIMYTSRSCTVLSTSLRCEKLSSSISIAVHLQDLSCFSAAQKPNDQSR